MPKAARLGDIGSEHDCFPSTPMIAGSPSVMINFKPAVRQGDPLRDHGCPCDKTPHGNHPRSVAGGSSGVFIDGKPAARLGDARDKGKRFNGACPFNYLNESSLYLGQIRDG